VKTKTLKKTEPTPLDIAIDALVEIAAYDDEGAQRHWRNTGKFTMFDEPGAVQTAREALRKIKRTSL